MLVLELPGVCCSEDDKLVEPVSGASAKMLVVLVAGEEADFYSSGIAD